MFNKTGAVMTGVKMKEDSSAVDGKGKGGGVEMEVQGEAAKVEAKGAAAEVAAEATKVVDERPRVHCEYCGRRLLRSNYQEHLRRVHRAPGRPCTSCSATLYSSLHHTCTSDQPGARSAGGDAAKKKWRCSTCGLATDLWKRLHLHALRSHYSSRLERHYEAAVPGGGYRCRVEGCHLILKHIPSMVVHLARVHNLVTREEVVATVLATGGVPRIKLTNILHLAHPDPPDISNYHSVRRHPRRWTQRAGEEQGREVVAQAREGGVEGRRGGVKKKLAMVEFEPACEYERVRAANIAERRAMFLQLGIGIEM